MLAGEIRISINELASRKKNGGSVRPEIYLDESYINMNHSRNDTWLLPREDEVLTILLGYWLDYIIKGINLLSIYVLLGIKKVEINSMRGIYHS